MTVYIEVGKQVYIHSLRVSYINLIITMLAPGHAWMSEEDLTLARLVTATIALRRKEEIRYYIYLRALSSSLGWAMRAKDLYNIWGQLTKSIQYKTAVITFWSSYLRGKREFHFGIYCPLIHTYPIPIILSSEVQGVFGM